MKRFMMLLPFITLITIASFGQSSFDADASAFHKKAVMVCATIKNTSSSEQQVNSALAAATAELMKLTSKYKDHPTSLYEHDPLWKSYFEDFADNLTLVKLLASQKEYSIASKYCNTFCQIFGRLHRNNGTVDLTDKLFALNMQMKLTTDMANAGNINGAREAVILVKKLYDQATSAASMNQTVEPLYAPVGSIALQWITALEEGDVKSADLLYKSFSSAFPKPFIASL